MFNSTFIDNITQTSAKMMLSVFDVKLTQHIFTESKRQTLELSTEHNNTASSSKGKISDIILVAESPPRHAQSLFDPHPATELL